MDLVKASLGPAGVNLLSDECLSVYLDEFDFLNQDCFKERFFIIIIFEHSKLPDLIIINFETHI